ncbi:MAG: flavin reductase family protein [Actinomycetota bacterium]|nr:flavin reductase family protein [Actinomycetota bacterium]
MVSEARFKAAMGRFATGVTVVAAVEDGEPVGFTCQSFVSLSLDPPLVGLAPAKTSASWPRIAQAGSFCVNVLTARQEDLCRRFARTGGEKFTDVAWHAAPVGGGPVIEGCLAWVDCRLVAIHDAGDHELVIGAVLDLGVGEGEPLLFYNAAFASIAPATGLDADPDGTRPAVPDQPGTG